ncbi:MAG TPA: error-prone DNA polymerase [Opitutaceae bacterium]|nr:error-prone DNA polymerase [Opitutaceae bacterium]
MYVELHAASAFSFLRGASGPEQLAEKAAALGLPALALLDRDGVYGAPRLYAAAREHGVRPLVGAEVTLADGSALPLLVQDRAGYQNLCRLITTAKLAPRPPGLAPGHLAPGEDPRDRKRRCFATWDELAAHADGLVALTGDEDGPVRRAWDRGGAAAVEDVMRRLRRTFGPDRLHVEVQRHRMRGEEATVAMLADLAAREKLPLLATGGVLYAEPGQRIVTDVFTCLRQHTTLDAAGRRLAVNENRHLHGAAHMQALFADLPEAVANTGRLAERLPFTLKDLGYRFPDYADLPPGHDMNSFLREVVYTGARKRYGAVGPGVRTQIDKELALIAKLGFAGYFLLVWDICRWARSQGTLIQGRGSAANSIVCYALEITAVDPVKQRLLFERFLSEGRQGADGHPSWPDIDLDLPSGDRREAVIQEVYRRYGQRGAALVANVITYRGRSSAREVGKVLGLADDVLDRFSALYANGDFPHTLGLTEQLQTSGLPMDHPRLPAMLAVCGHLQRNMIPRHLGQHSGGMILSPGGLDTIVPIENASMPGRTVVQWDKDDCEDLGLVKIDFLGLGMMAVIQDCRALCRERGRPFELYEVPQDDAATYAMMQRADTIGVFQIESRAQMATLPRIKPAVFYDVVIEVAIVRPGPIVGQLSSPLLRRRAGAEPILCLDPEVHERLLPVLGRTYGVILFQEQMLSVAMELAGFSGAEAEELRRALGFHRDDRRLQRVVGKLRAALQARGWSDRVVEKVVEATSSFALYGFPESHAFSFGLLAYVSTWLKAHRLAEFYAGLLNNQPMGFYSPATLVQDGRRHGLKSLPVCVARSDWNCTVEADDAIRIGLRYVKGLREAPVQAMVAERKTRPFDSLSDFLRRTQFTAAERRALAATGALNAFAGHRRAALWQVEAAWTAEENLFQAAGLAEDGVAPLAPMTLPERVQADFRGLELTAGAHPMALVRDRLPGIWRAADLPLGQDGERIVIGGSVICRQRPGTAKGVVFVSLEDETGVANAIVYAGLFERRRLVINEEPALRITGRLQNQGGVIHVQAEHIEPLGLADLPAGASHDFH